MQKTIFKDRLTAFRPVFFIAIYLTFGILIGYNIGQSKELVYMLGGACFILALFDLIKNKSIPFIMLYLLSFAIGIMLISVETRLEVLPAGESEITGRVVDVNHYEYSSYYILEEWEAKGELTEVSPRKKLSVKADDRDVEFGDVISFKGKLSYPKKTTNINGFDQRLYLLGRGVAYNADVSDDEINVISNKVKIDSYFYNVKGYFEDTIDTLFSNDMQGIAKGLILGEKGDISQEDYDKYKHGGTASILAVSGLHFGIISIFLFWCLSLIGLGRKTTYVITGILMFAYAGVVGFTVSALRALIMAWVIIIANLLGRRKDYLSFLCIAYIISLIINPTSLFTAGFLLSFSAVFSILALNKPLSIIFKWMPKKLRGLPSASIGASIGTAPIIINFFYYVSLIGVFANIIIIPIGSIAVIAVLISVLLGQTLGIPFAFIGEFLIKLMNDIMDLMLKIPFASLSVKALPIIFVILWFIMIFVVSKYFLARKKMKWILTIIIIIMMTVILFFVPFNEKEELNVYFFDVGQGDAAFIKTPIGNCYMIDTGRDYKYNEIERFLASNGYKLEGLFLTHSDEDHIGGLNKLVENGYVEKIYVSNADFINYEFSDNVEVEKLKRGVEVKLDDKTNIKVLYPDFYLEKEETNEMSLCLMLEYDEYRLLFTGDINEEIERKLVPIVENVDVLKVSHHGSKNASSSLFLSTIDPEYAVIMCGENYYGHPSDNTIYNLEKYCDIIYRTDENGGIMFSFSDDISIDTVMKKNIIRSLP